MVSIVSIQIRRLYKSLSNSSRHCSNFYCHTIFAFIKYKYFSKKKPSLIFNSYFFVKLLGAFYLVIVFYSSLNLRYEGAVFFIFVLCICVLSDIGGYILGKTIGGKRLTKVSPNKTISGSFGSFLFSLFPLGILMVLGFDENFFEKIIYSFRFFYNF